MLEKRAKVIEELFQTEETHPGSEMCIERIMVPLQLAQVGTRESELRHEHGSPGLRLRAVPLPQRLIGFEIKVVTAALNSRAPVDMSSAQAFTILSLIKSIINLLT